MLTKYTLVNVPKEGIRHPVGELGLVAIDERLTDEQAEVCIAAGLTKYFKKKELVNDNGKANNQAANQGE